MKKEQVLAVLMLSLSLIGCAKVGEPSSVVINENENVTQASEELTTEEKTQEQSSKSNNASTSKDAKSKKTEKASEVETNISDTKTYDKKKKNDTKTEEAEIQESESVRKNQVFENNEYTIMYTTLEVGATEIEKVKDDNVKIAFPKFRYHKGHELYNTEIQENINKQIQQLCIEADKDVIYSDYSTESEEHGYNLDYKITKAEDEYFSVKYEGQFTSRKYSMDIARGITIDTLTGEKIPVSDYVYIDVELYDNFVSGDVKFESISGYGREALVDHLEEFISSYLEGYVDEYTCFYIEDKTVSVIVPVHSGTSSYFEMKFDL